ncbi:hypothetical protein GGF46_000529 [Coemansia sp. RSA 552]|nr:hypothetical protein GGF46_000529 [Coemansia sp. RSA 552]
MGPLGRSMCVAAVATDPESWPDPATAASGATVQTQTRAPPAAAKKPSRKGKWVVLETDIQYAKPKAAAQASTAGQRPPKQSQQNGARGGGKQSTAPAAKDDADGAKGVRAPGSGAKKLQPRPESAGEHRRRDSSDGSIARSRSQDSSQGAAARSSARGRGPARGRGRGRARGQNHGQGYRGGPRTAGHAPSHYYGKGNVQAGGVVPVPLPQPSTDDEGSVRGFVKAQVEYYFSVDNLCKDIFFRTQMDPDGYVPLSLIAGFNRLRAVTTDMGLIRSAVAESKEVETDGTGDRVRRRDDWSTWLFPNQDVVLEKQQQQQQSGTAVKSE